MSHRVTTQTEIKDKAIAMAALKNAGLSFTESGNTLRITSGGQLRNAVINLSTGEISGDTDFGHTQDGLGIVRQHYGEAKFRAEAAKSGRVTIQQRYVDQKTGDVVLKCRMS
jgi:hypothetical protein